MRGKLLVLVLALILAVSSLAMWGTATALAAHRAASATVTATGLYANASGLVMDAGSARKSGVTVRVHRDGNTPGKRWLREPDGTIRPSYDTRLCLDVPKARYRAGVALDVATCENLKSQRFATARPSASTPVFFISPVGDRKLCLSLSDGFFDSGDAVTLAACAPMLTAPGTEVWAAVNLVSQAGELNSTIALGVAGTTAGSPVVATQPWALPLGSLWEVGTTSVAPFRQERVLRPVANTSLCLTRAGTEAAGTALSLQKCTGSPAQAFMGVEVNYNQINPGYYLTEPDGRFCVTIKAGATLGHRAVLGACVGTAADLWTAATWTTGIDLTAGPSDQYMELYTAGPYLSMSLGLTGDGPGAKTVVADDQQRADQVWTELPPSGRGFPGNVGNPDGTISLRPLSDTALCLTVPGARYAVGQQLSAQPCDGKPDQEFFRLMTSVESGTGEELIPYGDGRLCVGTPKGTKAGTPVALIPCAGGPAEAWIMMVDWYQWGGFVPDLYAYSAGGSPTPLTMGTVTGSSAVAEVAPLQEGDPSQAWLADAATGGNETYHPVADSGWCLDAPTMSAGAAVTVAPCDGSVNQEFAGVSLGGGYPAYFELAPAADSSLCLAVGASIGSGTSAVVLQSCSATATSQMWSWET